MGGGGGIGGRHVVGIRPSIYNKSITRNTEQTRRLGGTSPARRKARIYGDRRKWIKRGERLSRMSRHPPEHLSPRFVQSSLV